ncbi:hypothetical protein G9A89_000152 [Geosiphon pyriformis]|nr:hypothetical protein G9A89_000152 [Geosiphon pyriformis]
MNQNNLKARYTQSTAPQIDRCPDLCRINREVINQLPNQLMVPNNQQPAPINNPAQNPPPVHNNPGENIPTILDAQNIDFTVKEEFLEPTFIYCYRLTNPK